MHVYNNIKAIINHPDFLSYLIALILSTVLVGYAPSSIALGVFGFFVLRHTIINKVKIRIEGTLLLLVLLYLFFCVSYFWSVDQHSTLKGLGRTIPLLIMPIAFSLIPKFTFKKYNLILNCFTVSNVILGLFFLFTASVNYIKAGSLEVFTYHELVAVLDLNAIYVSVFFCISFFFLLSKAHKKLLEKGSIIFLAIMILLLSSKMMIVTFIICNIIYLIFYKGLSYFKSTKAIFTIILAVIIFGLTTREVIERFVVEKTTNFEEVLNKEKFTQVYPWTGTSIRLLQLRNLKEQILEDNILIKGFGLFASRKNLKKRHEAFNTYHTFHGYNYHNMYAQIFSELGVFGLLFLVVILVLNFRRALGLNIFLFVIFNIILFMLFITESFLWVHRGIFLFTILYCLFNRTNFNDIGTNEN